MNWINSVKAICLSVFLALALTACGGEERKDAPQVAERPAAPMVGSADEQNPEGEKPTAQKPRDLVLFIWSEYIDPEVLDEFERTHNVEITMTHYESNEEMLSVIKLGRQGAYDLIVPTTYYLPSMINQKLIQPLNHELLPNLKNLDPEFTDVEEDPGNRYSVAYQWGTSGLVIRAKPGQTYEPSFDLLFKPSIDKGNFIMFDTARDTLGAALKYLGYSANTVDQNQLREAGELVKRARSQPTFLSFSSGVDGLANVMGNVASIAQVYNGEAVKAAMEDPEVEYVIPKEGCEIWLDLFAIPTGAANVDVAHEFINYILEPENAAKLSYFSKYATPNAKAMELIPAEERENPGIYPPEELKAKMEYYKDLGQGGLLYEEIWTLVKSE